MLELAYLLGSALFVYGTIGGSLNPSLSYNPGFFGGYFTRVDSLEFIALYGFHSYQLVIMVN